MAYRFVLMLITGIIISCQSSSNNTSQDRQSPETVSNNSIDIQGHRGARGILPENSIRGFIKALDLGVNTLEMDLCVTKDGLVIVSHEPFMSSEICLDSERNMISEEEAQDLNIYEMTYEEVRAFDCGSLMHVRFPSQGKVKIVKPLLSDVFGRTEPYIKLNNLGNIRYNIELKSSEETDDIYHPNPEAFSKLVFEQIDGQVDWSRVTIQSFDFRILRYFKQNYPEVELSQLIENEESWEDNVEKLGFTPDVYSCYYQLLTPQVISDMHKEGIKVIPWTINDLAEMQKMIEWGVDGIITDYPDIAQQLVL